jgi:hypothetical protein
MVEQLAAERQTDFPPEMDVQDRKDKKTDHCPLHCASETIPAATCGVMLID